MNAPVVLELSALAKRFGGVTAVDSIDLQLHEGEFLVLLGPSGCGKSTTLRMLAGFEEPSSGTISVDGKVISRAGHVVPPERRGMGMIFQSYAIWPHMTVKQNVSFGPRIKGRRGGDLNDVVTDSLRTARIEELADRYPAELSGGQQQRVALARALGVKPRILLMDEPLSNLDAKLRHDLRHELRRVHAEIGFTGVYVTHDQAEAMALGNRVVVMRDGRIHQVGTPTDLYLRPKTEFVAGFLGRANRVRGVMSEPHKVKLNGIEVDCAEYNGFRSGTEVVAVVRPSGFRVVGEHDTDSRNTFECVVEDLTFLGETQECSLKIAKLGETLAASFPPFERLREGEAVRCRLEGIAVVPRDEPAERWDAQ